MKIEFIYSLEEEISRLTDLASEYQWFLDNNFPIVLPDFYRQAYQETKGEAKPLRLRISEELAKIYNEKQYIQTADEVKTVWQGIEEEFFQIINKLNLEIQDKYVCYISMYGPEGQFHYPNMIDLRASNQRDRDEANITIAHEIIHLAIYKKTQDLNLQYKQIEGVVDLMFTETDLKTLFPRYKLQSSAIRSKDLFNKFL